MKLVYIFCNGSRGDCEPGICLAQHMIKNGYSVRIYCNDGNESLLKKSGIDYVISFKNYINN